MARAMGNTGTGLLDQVATVLAEATFDPQHSGALFLRAAAELALRDGVANAMVWVAGRDDARIPVARFLGMTYRPDVLVVDGDAQVAVGITLLRADASALATAIAGAVLLARKLPVAVVVLDRRVRRADPFAAPAAPGMHPGDQAVIDYLAAHHQVRFVVRRQAPFGFG